MFVLSYLLYAPVSFLQPCPAQILSEAESTAYRSLPLPLYCVLPCAARNAKEVNAQGTIVSMYDRPPMPSHNLWRNFKRILAEMAFPVNNGAWLMAAADSGRSEMTVE